MIPVQLMITVTNRPGRTLIKVDGWLAGEAVAELVRVLKEAAAPARLLVQDLRGADAAGLSLLRRLADQGMPLDGLSPYIRLMLADPAGLGPLSTPSNSRPATPVRSTEE